MAGRNQPPAIAFHHSVSELKHAIEWFALRCSFHVSFSENNRHVIAVDSRLHIVIFEHIVVDIPSAQFIDLIPACIYLAI